MAASVIWVARVGALHGRAGRGYCGIHVEASEGLRLGQNIDATARRGVKPLTSLGLRTLQRPVSWDMVARAASGRGFAEARRGLVEAEAEVARGVGVRKLKKQSTAIVQCLDNESAGRQLGAFSPVALLGFKVNKRP